MNFNSTSKNHGINQECLIFENLIKNVKKLSNSIKNEYFFKKMNNVLYITNKII